MKYLILLILFSCATSEPEIKPSNPKPNYVKVCVQDAKKTRLGKYFSVKRIVEICKCVSNITDKSVKEIQKDKELQERIRNECI